MRNITSPYLVCAIASAIAAVCSYPFWLATVVQ